MGENDINIDGVINYAAQVAELEDHLQVLRRQIEDLRNQVRSAESENHALRSRLTAVALVIRP